MRGAAAGRSSWVRVVVGALGALLVGLASESCGSGDGDGGSSACCQFTSGCECACASVTGSMGQDEGSITVTTSGTTCSASSSANGSAHTLGGGTVVSSCSGLTGCPADDSTGGS